jgi:DNA segregation ATPase FtsK/SpoIIIE-like protein
MTNAEPSARTRAPLARSSYDPQENTMIRHPIRPHATLRRPVLALSVAAALGLLAVPGAQAQVSVDVDVSAPLPGWAYDLGAVVSVFVDPPLEEPAPVAIAWAPPPMLVEVPPPPPDPFAVWTGGYWTWQGDWVWCAGRWVDPPRPNYVWVQPYYEHRDDRVIFIPGYWSSPEVEFVAPVMAQPIPWAVVAEGVVVGPPPIGPVGIFVPPPPGSRPGIIVPAPIGTPPAVVVGAPPVMAVGMRVTGAVTIDARHTVINDNRVTNYSVTNVRNVTNVTVVAPASATASGRPFQAQVPHQAHLAAAQRPVVAARAPAPASRTPVAAYVPGRPVARLPAPQRVQGLPAVPPHAVATIAPAVRGALGHAPLTPDQARQAHAGAGAGREEPDTRHFAAPAAGPVHAASPQPEPPAERSGRPLDAREGEAAAPGLAAEQERQRAARQDAVQEREQPAQDARRQQAEQQRQQAEQQQRQQAEQRAEQQRDAQVQREQAQQRAEQLQEQQARQRAQQAEEAQRAQAEQRAQQQAQQRAQEARLRQQQAQQQAMQQQAQQQRAQQERVQQERVQPEEAQRARARAPARQEEASRPSGRE